MEICRWRSFIYADYCYFFQVGTLSRSGHIKNFDPGRIYMYILRPVMDEALNEVKKWWRKRINEIGGIISGGNFPGGNSPRTLMRKHLLPQLENETMTPFPQQAKRVKLGKEGEVTHRFPLYCKCRVPFFEDNRKEGKGFFMAFWSVCGEWYHRRY